MPTLTFNGESFLVHHAVKGPDFVHGYDDTGILIVAFDGVTDFSLFSYDGTYMDPGHCRSEGCNDVKFVGGTWQTRDGSPLLRTGVITLTAASWEGDDPYTQRVSVAGTTARSKVDMQPDATTIMAMMEDGVSAMYVANDNGDLTVYALGEAPSVDITVQVTVTEVAGL